ncbi:hypothetical protein DVA86_30195 [Streptomyces armeniacus]|uniref:Uncharacterized protein n=1 Tax=Streptomyces armeniacus TaxID=83291 RepID=A0A345XX63_9ACTN|nr:hypothetical protein [Streptomyces armeniacus]AXK36229.1 hypothetical protein DVA86_30195 [Streptomyces armeniacus]
MTGTNAQRTTRYDRWTYGKMNDSRLSHLHATRAQRHRIVAAHVVVTAAATAGLMLLYGLGQPWWLALLVGATVLWIPLTGLLNSMTRGLLELRLRILDERQVAEREAVLARAHRGTLLVMVACFLGVIAAHAAGATISELGGPIAAVGAATLVVHWLMPLWIAGFRAEDEPGEDEMPATS